MFKTFSIILLIAFAHLTQAQESVVLNPVKVSGTTNLNNVIVETAWVSAKSGSESGLTRIINDNNLTTIPYELFLNVESGRTRHYDFTTRFYIDSSHISRSTPNIAVTDGQPKTLNFSDFDLAQVKFNVTIPVESSIVHFSYETKNSDDTENTTIANVSPIGHTGPILAGFNLTTKLTIHLDTGEKEVIEQTGVNISPNTLHIETINIEAQTQFGSLSGIFDFQGSTDIHHYFVQINSGNSGAKIYPFSPTSGNRVEWQIDDVPVSTDPNDKIRISIGIRYRHNSLIRIAQYDPSLIEGDTFFELRQGEHKVINLVASQAHIKGKLNFIGKLPPERIFNVSYGTAIVDKTNLEYELLMSEGMSLKPEHLYVYYYLTEDNNQSLHGSFNIIQHAFPNNNYRLSPGEVYLLDQTIDTGSLTIGMSTTDNRPISDPLISTDWRHNCRFSKGQFIDYVWSTHSTHYNIKDNTTPTPTIYGPAGTCDPLKVYGNVNNSTTLFGAIQATITPGADTTIDINGPTLSLDVEPNSQFTSSRVVITGRATDDNGIDTITVNGETAIYVSTNNPSDLNEVEFSLELNLPDGKHEIHTIATDTALNTAQDKRSIEVSITSTKVCDANNDSKIDKTDIRLIYRARNQPALTNDPRDFDLNGKISMEDARSCQAKCDLPRCATE